MVSADAITFEMPPDFQNLVQNVINGLSYFSIRDDIDVVEDTNGVGEFFDLNWIIVNNGVHPNSFWFYGVERFVFRQGAEEIDGLILIFFQMLLEIFASIGGFPRATGTCNVENRSFFRRIWNVLKFGIVRYLELSELLDETIAFFSFLRRKLIRDRNDLTIIFATTYFR
jgi:hypothetical protein